MEGVHGPHLVGRWSVTIVVTARAVSTGPFSSRRSSTRGEELERGRGKEPEHLGVPRLDSGRS